MEGHVCLESAQKTWLQDDSGHSWKGSVCPPLPLPTAILLSRSFHTQRGCNQVSVGCSEYAWTIWARS